MFLREQSPLAVSQKLRDKSDKCLQSPVLLAAICTGKVSDRYPATIFNRKKILMRIKIEKGILTGEVSIRAKTSLQGGGGGAASLIRT